MEGDLPQLYDVVSAEHLECSPNVHIRASWKLPVIRFGIYYIFQVARLTNALNFDKQKTALAVRTGA